MIKSEVHPELLDRYLDQPYLLAGRIVDPISGNVGWQGKQAHLQRKDLEVLALLASNPGEVISRSSFIAVVWDGNDLVGDRGVSDKIFSLRRALQDHDESQPIIRTIPRRGYQLSQPAVQPAVPEQPTFSVGGAIVGCTGWRLLRRLSATQSTENWLVSPEPDQLMDSAENAQPAKPRVFSFCRSESQLRRFQRETTLLRYLNETLGERADIALVRDWQLQEPPYFLARDYCTYGSLSDWASSVGGLASRSIAQRETLVKALAAAVASVHEIGMVHGQLTAQSMLFDTIERDDSQPQLKLSAFDLGTLSDRSKLAPLKITALGLSFSDGMESPKRVDDIKALGALMLQILLGDLTAQPNPACLQRLADARWRRLIGACFGPESEQPSAAVLAQGVSEGVPPVEPSQYADDTALLSSKPHFSDLNPAELLLSKSIPAPAASEKIQASPSPAALQLPATGQVIGPYRVFEKLGQGGMGAVFLAEQRQPVQRHVALKVILAGLDTEQVLARFEAERQALALMNHVNIASVFDAGSSAAGRPYFAMEYVPGLEITAHCDQHAFDFRARITLFLQVCSGVLHAHQKGIIHRDLKPSNILIKSAQGQQATAKIIDFGVAKSLQGKLGNLTAHTQLGSFVGTRMYSSPEQVSGNTVDVDTRSDIYSLGVVLYELLAGVAPYRDEDLGGHSPVALTNNSNVQEPPTLLKRFVSLDAQVEADIALQRQMSVTQMKALLGSDLSWIVAKCMEHDANERYASVLELEKDLQRWLENRPIEARPITGWYRFRKIVRRNRGKFALGSAVALALLVSTGVAVFSYLRSEQALAEAELVAGFQAKQIQSIDPNTMGNALRKSLLAKRSGVPKSAGFSADLQLVNMTDIALEQLDAMYFEPALAAIEKDFGESPLLQARLMQSLGENLHDVGRYEKAKQVFEAVLAQRIKLLGAGHALAQETILYRGMTNEGLGLNRPAEADYRAALAGLRQRLGVQHPQTILAMKTLGRFLLTEWRDSEAYELLQESARVSRLALGNKDERFFSALNLYSVASMRLGQLDQAEKLASEALAGLIALHGKVHQESLFALQTVADVAGKRGKRELAESYQREVLDGIEQLLGDKHHFALAARHNLAVIIAGSGRYAESISLYREVHRDLQTILGPDHPSTLISQIQFGGTLREAGQFAEAKQVLDAALQSIQGSEIDSGALMFDAIYQLGQLAKDQGKFDEAEHLLNQSLAGRRKVSGENHEDTLDAKKALEELKTAREAAER